MVLDIKVTLFTAAIFFHHYRVVYSLLIPAPVDYNEPLRKFNVVGHYSDCVELHVGGHRQSGVYHVVTRTNVTSHKTLRCHQTPQASWTVVQQRTGNGNFDLPWSYYVQGFGNIWQDFWLGLDALHTVTQHNDRWLQVNLHDWAGNIWWAAYRQFYVGPKADRYRLSVSQFYGNVTQDDLSNSNGQQFSTWDVQDRHGCAGKQRAGWWYNYCAFTLLNGRYYVGGWYKPNPSTNFWDGIYWQSLHGYNYSMKYVSMLVGLPNVNMNRARPAGLAEYQQNTL